MASLEERLAALERAQADMNHSITMLLEMIGEQGRDIKRISATLEQHTSILGSHTSSFSSLRSILGSYTSGLGSHTDILRSHTTILDAHTERLKQILTRLNGRT